MALLLHCLLHSALHKHYYNTIYIAIAARLHNIYICCCCGWLARSRMYATSLARSRCARYSLLLFERANYCFLYTGGGKMHAFSLPAFCFLLHVRIYMI